MYSIDEILCIYILLILACHNGYRPDTLEIVLVLPTAGLRYG
jgi:hypothetical protein